MRFSLLIFLTLIAGACSLRADDTLQQQYLAVYLKINDAEHQERRNEYAGAAASFRDIYDSLMKIRHTDPSWESALVEHRLQDCAIKIHELDEKVVAEAKIDDPSQPTLVHQVVIDSREQSAFDETLRASRVVYPWKDGILTTMFWIGEDSSHASAWNENWTKSNHGTDDPDNRNGFASAEHASSVNPFYVALPFNDLAHPDKAHDWVPHSWQRPALDGKPMSACKDRWVSIKSKNGRVCYAQWEDVGPDGNDHAEYVFGKDLPPAGKPGLDISPAVAQYLGIDGNAGPLPSLVSWRFVDDQDVPPGQWLKYDEQAVLYSALHQVQKSEH